MVSPPDEAIHFSFMVMVNERSGANWSFLLALLLDIHMLRLPGPCLGRAEPRVRVWADTKQDAGGHGVGVGIDTACIGVRAVHAGCIPDRGVEVE
jgi:hypothetical protein